MPMCFFTSGALLCVCSRFWALSAPAYIYPLFISNMGVATISSLHLRVTGEMRALLGFPSCPLHPSIPPTSWRNLINPSLATPLSTPPAVALSASPAVISVSSFQLAGPSRRRLRGSFLVRCDDGDKDLAEVDIDAEEVEGIGDYDIDYEPQGGSDAIDMSGQSKSFVSTMGGEAESVINYRINEDEFHRISLLQCDFLIRKPSDPDENVYDFREMYVSPPDKDVYSIPRVFAPMPEKYIRCTKSDFGCYNITEPPVDALRDPLYKSEKEIHKVFLVKHYRNRRRDDPEFFLDFEEVYVIDSKTKSITRAKVVVTIPEGRNRDRMNDLLIIRDGGTSFKIIDKSQRDDPTTVIHRHEWEKSRQEMEKHLSKLRDFNVSNWF